MISASPDVTALHFTINASVARAQQWKPFAFRLVRACAIIDRHSQVTAAEKFLSKMQTHALSLADVASAIWSNVIINPAPVETSLYALISSAPKSSATWVCSCCCYASQYALVCAFFVGQASNVFFVDVITGSACSCFPVKRAVVLGSTITACACANEFIAATDAMSLFLYRSNTRISLQLIVVIFCSTPNATFGLKHFIECVLLGFQHFVQLPYSRHGHASTHI